MTASPVSSKPSAKVAFAVAPSARDLIKDRAAVLTAENLELSYEVAGIGHRFVAAFVDHLILFGITIGLWGSGAWIIRTLSELRISSNLWVAGLIIFIQFAVYNGYFIFFEIRWNGQSIGKRRMNIRVIKEGGFRLDFTSSVIRNVMRVIDYLPFFYALGGALVALTPHHRRLGDIAAGTIVVVDPRPRWHDHTG
ncbi:MAG: RDD family protein [bacterium JZ-2024 1]